MNIKNTNPPTLSLESLKSTNIFELYTKATYGDNLLESFIRCSSDGIIEDVNQGNTNDCYFLSGLLSLCSTPQGQEMVKNAIQWSEDGSYVNVYFAGLGKYIKVTMDEIKDAIKNDKHSSGDVDVLIMELAMENIIGEKDFDNGGFAREFWRYFIEDADTSFAKAYGFDDIGQLIGGLFHWSSGAVDLKDSAVEKFLYKLWKADYDGKGYAATFSFLTTGDTTWSWTDVYGETHTVSMDLNALTFAITEITSNTVTFANPWDSENLTYTVTWEEFVNMSISQFSMVTY